MSTKRRLLSFLEGSRAELLSGEEVAKKMGVSRAAVWKAVKSLREEGLSIESVPGVGYRLLAGSDLLSTEAMQHYGVNTTKLRVFSEVDSTNLEAKRWAIDGAPHGAMVIAERQTAGRGRLGRSFVSPPGGLYLSVVLRPKCHNKTAVLITAAAAVAVCRTVSHLCGLELSIKWVNDLFYQGKKCCGILTEAGTGVESGSIEYMVVGIGINYTTPAHLLESVEDVATSLFISGAMVAPRAQLAAEVQNALLGIFGSLEQRQFLAEYRNRSLVIGKMVTVMDMCPYIARAIEIDEDAQLIVERENGERKTLSYGEISVKM